MPDAARILIVDDDTAQVEYLRTVLAVDGWEVVGVTSGGEALDLLDRGEEADVIVSDLFMPGMDGRALLEAVLARRPEVPVIILTAHASVDSAVELLHAGAYHYVAKPAKLQELRLVVRRAREATETRRELARLRRRVQLPEDVVGVSRAMHDVLEAAIRVAPTTTPVLITGESGAGKEVVARAIHAASGRAAFVALNCAAIPPAQFEAELFGAPRGTGEMRDHAGALERAREGTLFLDDVSEVPLALQLPLARLVETGTFLRGGEELRSTARIIAASSRDPAEAVAAGRMREELLLRLDVVRLHLPPLRERPVDIPALAHHLLERLAARFQLDHADLAPDTLAALTNYTWPGNIRELENVLARALAVRTGRMLTPRDLPAHIAKGPSALAAGAAQAAPLTLEEVERRHILQVLERTEGNKLKAAEILGIDRSTLHRKLKQIQGIAALKL
jgi:DNA-binding NtrC family response regulator